MEFVTGKQYWEYLHNSVMQVKEEGRIYQLEKVENKIYEDKKLNKIDKIHDKMFRNILSKKREMVKFLNQFGNLEERMSYYIPNGDYPIIVPFVIYTGYQKWNAKTNFAQR